MTKTPAWAALGWTVALNVVWAVAMTAATLFLVVLGAVVDVFVDEVQPTADWYVSRMLVAYDLLTGRRPAHRAGLTRRPQPKRGLSRRRLPPRRRGAGRPA